MKETDAVRCDNKENGEEERHHSTKQRDMEKRCKFGSQNTWKSSS